MVEALDTSTSVTARYLRFLGGCQTRSILFDTKLSAPPATPLYRVRALGASVSCHS